MKTVLAVVFSLALIVAPGHSKEFSHGRVEIYGWAKVEHVVAMIVEQDSCDCGVVMEKDVAAIQVPWSLHLKSSNPRALLEEFAQAMSLQLTELGREEKFVWFRLDKKAKK